MLHNGDFIKATVNGKKAGLILHNNEIWLLSYVSAWDTPSRSNYNNVPRKSFAKKKLLWFYEAADACFETWQEWRDFIIANLRSYDNLRGIETIYFPGEQGYERVIRPRNDRRSAARRAAAAEAAQATETATRPSALSWENAPTVETLPEPPAEVTIDIDPTGPPRVERVGEGIDHYLPNYSTENVYQGQGSYHSNHGRLNRPVAPFTGHRIGVELEIEANTAAMRDEINARTSNWFYREHDGSLGQYGIEIITVPLLPEDAKSYTTWQPLCNYLKNKAKSWDTGRCGLHVHIGREILGETETERQMTLGKLLIFYQGEVEDWVKATAVFGRARCYHQPTDGETEELKAVKVLGKEVLKDPNVLRKVDRAMKDRFGESRYYAINLHNAATIEFRKGRGSINADRIIAVITMTEAICLYCKATDAHNLSLEGFQEWLFMNVPCGNPVFRYLNISQADR